MTAGLSHLAPYFGDGIVASPEPVLTVDLPDAVLDAPLPSMCHVAPPPSAIPPEDWAVLRGDGSFTWSVALLLDTMSAEAPATLSLLARSAGLSKRSAQRALKAEGTSFRSLSDALRRARALDALHEKHQPMSQISASLGYTSQSSFTRAVRRWTGAPPRECASTTARPSGS